MVVGVLALDIVVGELVDFSEDSLPESAIFVDYFNPKIVGSWGFDNAGVRGVLLRVSVLML